MDSEQQDVRHATINSLCDGLRQHPQVLEVFGLHGSASAYVLAELLAASPTPLVIICEDQEQGRRLIDELKFFHQHPHEIALLPHWELNPYDPLSPHPELEANRMAALSALLKQQLKGLVVPVRALMQKTIPRQVLEAVSIQLVVEEEYPREQLVENFMQLGYQPVPLVEERGNFAVRGDIIDIFPPAAEQPIRIDFYGDFIERMRPFNPENQRSDEQVLDRLELIPAREMILHGPFLDTFAERLKLRCDELAIARSDRETIMTEVREGILAPGRSFLLPFNYTALDSLTAYLGNSRPVIIDPPAVEQEVDRFHRDIRDGETRMQNSGAIHVRRQDLFLEPQDISELTQSSGRLELSRLQVLQLDDSRQRFRFSCHGNANLKARPQEDLDGLEPLLEQLHNNRKDGLKTLLVCYQRSQAERLQQLLAAHDIQLQTESGLTPAKMQPGTIRLTVGPVHGGFFLPQEKLNVISDEDIFGPRSHRRKKTGRQRARQLMASLAELREGDFIVHTDHGIGRYLGLTHLVTGALEGDFLHLEYAGNDKLYLPIERIEKIQKYVGGEGYTPKLDKMGGQGWEKARLKARAAVEELARQLLELYAKRELRQGFAFSPPDQLFQEFEATFPHEETADQLQAIQDTLQDMQSEKPMDRLICGDVGYGKTEVALRAAVKAVLDNKQVAVLVPTTVLARQHWESFRQRLSDFPIRVEMVSRFRSTAENKATLEAAAEGKIDILIGTHRLLQRDVRFKDLGLLIVDEEQRFGVSHKEKLKQLRAEVDILTLSATPIPRTLI